MESLGSLINARTPREPEDIAAIKQFVYAKYKVKIYIEISNDTLTLLVPGAALASTLRMQITALQKIAKPGRRLVIRISYPG